MDLSIQRSRGSNPVDPAIEFQTLAISPVLLTL